MATATVVAVGGDTSLHAQDREMSMGARMSPRLESSTPTRESLAGLSAQRPLPDEPLSSEIVDASENRHKRSDSFASSRLTTRDMDDDVDMDDGDADTAVEDDASDNESATSERPSKKKKKGQRFFCTEFPPCQLSFTRSEHLARHIRKHTGERPFQCHCSRRFSRLDNLRQHAQTVHVNEEIPGDSLAATSTRFQRQIRTDRVKSGSRPRTSAASGPSAPHPRGHSRNLSTSSIASTSSFVDEPRARPPTLAIATGSKRASGHMDDYDASPHSYFSQSGLSTPTSQSFSNVGSPSYTPGYASPASRSSFYGSARHSRRLSVPNGPNPFQQPMHPASFYTPMSSQASVYSSTSGYASPTSSIYSHSRRDSETEVEYRRRTWHPSSASTTQRPATSGLSYHQTPDEPRPALSQQPAASQVTRLPGIESFDHVSPSTPRQPASPMVIDARPPTSDRYEPGLHQNFHRLEIATNHNSTAESSYQPPRSATQAYISANHFSPQSQVRHQHHISMPEVPITPRKNKRQGWYGGPISPASLQQPSLAARPSPEDSGSSDGAPTPLTFQGQEYHPAIVSHEQPQLTHHVMPATIEEQEKAHQFAFPARPTQLHSTQAQEYQQKPAQLARADSGFQAFAPNTAIIAPRPPLPPSQYERYMTSHIDNPPSANAGNDMGRLEALVAVATTSTC